MPSTTGMNNANFTRVLSATAKKYAQQSVEQVEKQAKRNKELFEALQKKGMVNRYSGASMNQAMTDWHQATQQYNQQQAQESLQRQYHQMQQQSSADMENLRKQMEEFSKAMYQPMPYPEWVSGPLFPSSHIPPATIGPEPISHSAIQQLVGALTGKKEKTQQAAKPEPVQPPPPPPPPPQKLVETKTKRKITLE